MFRCFVALALVFAGTVACKSSDDIRKRLLRAKSRFSRSRARRSGVILLV